MQTTPTINPANLIASTVPVSKQANKQADANAPATPFNQVLSREVADRGKAGAKVNEPRPADTAPARHAKEVQAKPAQAKSGEAKPADKKEATAEADGTAVAEENAAAMPADMLALVASLNPPRPSADVPTEEKELKEAVDAIYPGVDVNALAAANVTATDKTTVPANDATKLLASGEAKLATADSKLAAVAERGNARTSKPKEAWAEDQSRNRASTDKPAMQDLNAKPAHEGAMKLADAGNPGTQKNDFAAEVKDAATVQATGKPAMQDLNTNPAHEGAIKLADAGNAATQKNDFAAEVKDALAAAQVTATPQIPQAALHAANAANAVNAAAAHLNDRLAPQVGTPGWDKALGQKITWMVAGEQQTASLTLNPPDLGPLQVVLSVSNSQANAAFTSAQPEVRQAIEAAMPKLREMLGEAGIQLGQATVDSGAANQHSAQDQRQFQPGMARVAANNGRAEPVVRVGRVQPATPSGRGLVDTFV